MEIPAVESEFKPLNCLFEEYEKSTEPKVILPFQKNNRAR